MTRPDEANGGVDDLLHRYGRLLERRGRQQLNKREWEELQRLERLLDGMIREGRLTSATLNGRLDRKKHLSENKETAQPVQDAAQSQRSAAMLPDDSLPRTTPNMAPPPIEDQPIASWPTNRSSLKSVRADSPPGAVPPGELVTHLDDVFQAVGPLQSNTVRFSLPVFYNVITDLALGEVEGRQCAFGLILYGETPPAKANLRVITECSDLPGALAGTPANYIEMKDLYREELAQIADGGYRAALARLDATRNQVVDISVYTGSAQSAHEQYIDVSKAGVDPTSGRPVVAIWVKERAAIRLYRGGLFIAQMIHLRDGHGWSLRMADELRTLFIARCKDSFSGSPVTELQDLGEFLIEVMMEMAERGLGASVYVFEGKESFDRASERAERKGVPLSVNEPVHRLPRNVLVNALRRDGSVALDSQGHILAAQAYFGGKNMGGRRKSASWVCSQRDNHCVALVASQDGPLYLPYFDHSVDGAATEDNYARFAVDTVRFR